MIIAKRLATLLLDPRGRMSRQDLLIAAVFMLTLDLGLSDSTQGGLLYVIKLIAYWVGCVGVVKRLHDVGRTGWWLVWGAGGLCIWAALLCLAIVLAGGFATLQPGGIGHIALLGALLMPALGMTLWLHLAPGDPGTNRFGPKPSAIVQGEGVRQAFSPAKRA